MKIVAQVLVSLHRADGSRSVLDEQITVDTGDNPKFEPIEVDAAIDKVHALVMDRMGPKTEPKN